MGESLVSSKTPGMLVEPHRNLGYGYFSCLFLLYQNGSLTSLRMTCGRGLGHWHTSKVEIEIGNGDYFSRSYNTFGFVAV